MNRTIISSAAKIEDRGYFQLVKIDQKEGAFGSHS